MLKSCPECELPVSDQAFTCPHCGYPLKTFSQKSTPGNFKKRNHKRLPNGFGQITKLSNPNLRKPFRAMITAGKTEEGRPIQKLLKPEAYFKTYNEAYEALLEYNTNPQEQSSHLTLAELWDKWYDDYAVHHYNHTSLKTMTSEWKNVAKFYSVNINSLKPLDIRQMLDEAGVQRADGFHPASSNIKAHLKSTLNKLLDYATEYQYIERNPSRDIHLPEAVAKEIAKESTMHISFTDEEMQILWAHTEDLFVRMMLIECYSGWRPQELLNIKLSDVDLTLNTMTGGLKTASGKNRTIPIHSKIKSLIESEYQASLAQGHVYLFEGDHRKPFVYDKYYRELKSICRKYKLTFEHNPHDCRKQFVTMAKRCNVNDYAIKRIVGHKIKDLTEAVYTYRDLDWLRSEIEKINV